MATKYSAVFQLEGAAWPALLLDHSSTICRANAAAVHLLGQTLDGDTPMLAAVWSEENALPPEKFLAQWERSPSPTMAVKLRAKGGVSITAAAAICSFLKDGQKFFLLQLLPEIPTQQDQTDPKTLDAGLAHKQKLECALQLARTVALDFNNALTSILGHTSLVIGHLEPKNPWRASLMEVEKSAARAAEIANDLGMFSLQQKETRTQKAENLNLLVQRTADFFQQQKNSTAISWELLLEKQPFTTRFDEAKMQQALVRVLENSVQAFTGPGRISIQTRNLELSECAQDQTVELAPGAHVVVEITDDGQGIPPEALPRIFEPFFTTKGGEHRGLGLALVYGVITNHGGGVAVSSRVGLGTSVRIYLPAEKRLLKSTGLPAADLRGNQTVLIVDDEDLLLTMGQTILSTYGYRVLSANSGQKALEVLSANSAVDLVITDLVMPGMSGRELVERIYQDLPEVRVLCTSGYVWPSGHHSESAYLRKPFTSQELLLKVKEVLTAEPPCPEA